MMESISSPARKAFATTWRRTLLAALILGGAFLTASGVSFAQSPTSAKGSPQDYERRCLAKLKGMMASHDLTEWQFTQITYLLGEQASMIDLFSKHGLLSESELQKKIRMIQEVTRFNVDDIFTPDQLGIWLTWDLKLDAAEIEKPRFRRRLLAVPQR